jgi:hypothetical protein
VGRVARRCLGTASAIASRSAKRARANSRFRACERSSWAIATTRGPTRARMRSRCVSVSACEACTSKLASTREAVTLACWPPGPEERLARTVTSDSGIVSPSVIRSVRLSFSSMSLNVIADIWLSRMPVGCADYLFSILTIVHPRDSVDDRVVLLDRPAAHTRPRKGLALLWRT